ncbi:MAG: alcohol dehydrogenase catalytic domain-containing protein [Deltaproteobacteria bacterium]|nr:alcohol dehydrogenase catalytic domain-containing protein [Deltaproteobacteria bacterium]
MQAAALCGKQDLRIGEVDVPQIDDGEILLQVKGAFVCGTDVRMYHNGYQGVSEATPLVLGHEGSGVVARVGGHVKNYNEGMRVAVAPNIGCGICDYCVSGNTHLCLQYNALGIHMPGFFAEYIKIPENFVRQGNVVEIPDSLSFEEAALAEPLACVFNAFEKSRMRPGEIVLIIGAGPIGLMHAKMAQTVGVEKILINDLSRERLDLCRQLDSSFITVESENLKEDIDGLTEGRGVDVCITACPAPQAQQIALELAAINGRIIFFGGLPPDTAHVSLNTNLIHYKQLEVTGTTRQSLIQYRRTLRLVACGRINIGDLISSRTALKDIQSALDNISRARSLKSAIFFE